MKLSNHRIAGAVLVGVSFLLALLLCILFYRTWRKDGKFVFFGDNARNDPFLSHRSLFAWLGFGVYCIFEMTVNRVAVVWVMVCHKSFPGGKLAFVMFECLVYSMLFSIPLVVRCWRLRVRHMYYVVLGNADWSKLMDPSVEDSLSFWVKHKALLTSNRGVSAVVLLYTTLVLFLVAVFHNNLVRVRKAFMITVVITLLLSPLLLYKIPHNRDCLKLELQICAVMVMFTMAMTATFVAIFGDSPVSSLINQSLYSSLEAALFVLSFYWLPRRVEQSEESGDALVLTHTHSRRKVLDVFKNIDVVMAFAKHCSDNLCVENLLAVLEIKEFKTMLCLEEDSKSERQRRASAVDSIGPNDDDNVALFGRHSRAQSISMISTVLEEWHNWDTDVRVSLSQLGCHSAIVNGSGDARSKALALCNKYFEWDSEFLLNISHKSRTQVLALVGKDASAKLQSEALLSVFDESMKEVFANLFDAIHRFEKRNDL